MFLKDLTAIITVKDRPVNLEYCINSIAACYFIPKTIVVDFGSTISASAVLGKSFYSFLKIIRVERDVDLFHKARAINIGLRAVDTKFLCITDVDEIFNPNFFKVVHNTLITVPKAFVMCKTHFLKTIPAEYCPSKVAEQYSSILKLAKTNPEFKGDGCCNGVLTKWLYQVRGYDEQYRGYAAEDSDVALRARLSGCKIRWIHNKTNMVHLPHPCSGVYYSGENIKRNRELFFNKRKRLNKKDIIVNDKHMWGRL